MLSIDLVLRVPGGIRDGSSPAQRLAYEPAGSADQDAIGGHGRCYRYDNSMGLDVQTARV